MGKLFVRLSPSSNDVNKETAGAKALEAVTTQPDKTQQTN
jgi:hypothetical protein